MGGRWPVLLAGRLRCVFLRSLAAKGVMDYIRDQERHHARRSFADEYLRFLKKYEIELDEKYISNGGLTQEGHLTGLGRFLRAPVL